MSHNFCPTGPGGGGASSAPDDCSYLVLGACAGALNSRTFTPGTGLTAVDGGAGGAYTLNVGPNIPLTGANTSVFVDFGDGQNVPISAVAHGRIRFNAATGTLQFSENGGAYQDFVPPGGPIGTCSPGVAGRVAFYSAANTICHDANFTWSGTTLTVVGNLTQSLGAVTLTANAASSFTTSAGALTITAAAASVWSTAAGALRVDSAAGLNLGTVAATAVGIGHAGITTTITGGLTQLTGAVSLTANAGSTFTTTVGAISIDPATTLNLGVSTATAIAIGHTGITTTVVGTLGIGTPASANTGVISFANATNVNLVTLQAGVTGASQTYTLPITAPPVNGAALTSTTAGVMSWTAAVPPSGSGANTRIAFWTGASTLGSDANFTWDGTRMVIAPTIVIGSAATAAGALAIAIGTSAAAAGTQGVALGNTATASGNFSTSIGTQSTATQTSATSLGGAALATGTNATVIGSSSTCNSTSGLTVGFSSGTSGARGITIGNAGSCAGDDGIAIGTAASSAAANVVAIGRDATSAIASAFVIGSATFPLNVTIVSTGTFTVAQGATTLGTVSVATGVLRFANAASALLTAFQAGNATAAVTYTWPTAAPLANGASLTSTTAGVMSWTAAASPTGSGAANQVTFWSGTTTLSGAAGFTFDGTQTVTITGTAPVFVMTDTTGAASSLTQTLDANNVLFAASAAPTNGILVLDLANKRLGINGTGVTTVVPGFVLHTQVLVNATSSVIFDNNSNGTSAFQEFKVRADALGSAPNINLGQASTAYNASTGAFAASLGVLYSANATGVAIAATNAAGVIMFFSGGSATTNETLRLDATNNGIWMKDTNLAPNVDNTGNLGTAAKRWKLIRGVTITSGDLHLQDEDRGAHWILREELEHISVINKINGKRYKMVLEEEAA